MTRISVCMASYNGCANIQAQIASILAQLGPQDELIVCDDNSSDNTRELVAAFNDPRIQLHRNPVRLGYVGNFSRALQLATGDLVLLSDQDDVWHLHKIARVREIFDRHTDITMVHHERALIDETGVSIGLGVSPGTGVRKGLPFVLCEFMQARLWGCCIAMRAPVVRKMLPFPSTVYAHDHWATAVAALSGGICLLPERLISHRQHERNVTPKHGLALKRRIAVRLRLLFMIVEAWRRARATALENT